MAINDQIPFTEKLSAEANWNAVMDALEMNWLSRILDTQTEYREEHMKLFGNCRNLQSE